MSQAPAMPLFADAYLADTMHLSLEEHGAYLKLLMITWRNNGQPLPDNDARISRMLGVSAAKWRAKLRPVLAPFFDLSEGVWSQKRLEKEWIYVAKNIEKNRENGKRGGRPKSLESNDLGKAVGSSWDNPNETQTESTHPHPHPHPQKEEGGRGSAGEPAGAMPSDGTEAATVAARFITLRSELWPTECKFPAPTMTLQSQASEFLKGAPLALVIEVMERGMRSAAEQGQQATHSLKAFHRSMATASINHQRAATVAEGGNPNDPRNHSHRRSGSGGQSAHEALFAGGAMAAAQHRIKDGDPG